MITMDESIKNLFQKGLITQEEAFFRAEDKKFIESFF
jgi:twitching motility protein PilT